MKRTKEPRSETSKEDGIELYKSANIALIPCGGGKERKIPTVKDWPSTPVNPQLTPSDLPEYFGAVLTDELVVIDYDPRKDRNCGTENSDIKRLCRDLGISSQTMRSTFTVKTGRVDGPGYHYYFKNTSNIRVKNITSLKGYPGIDIKTKGGYVVAAGSKHFTGGTYTAIRGDINKLVEVPPELLKLIKAAKAKANKHASVEINDEATRERFISFLNNAPPAIENQGGNQQTYQVACVGRDNGLPEEATFELLAEHYNGRCAPPWDIADLEEIVGNAYRYAQNSQGCKNPKVVFDELNKCTGTDAQDNATGISAIQTIAATELINKHFEPPRWAVPPILPEGLTILAGPPKVGKSFLAYSLAIAVAGGGTALGRFQSKEGKVLYLALEDNQRRLKERLAKLTFGNIATISNQLLLTCDSFRADNGGIESLELWLSENQDCRLVIIDTFARFSPRPDGRLNAYENDYRALGELQKLAISKRIALVLITHLRKQQSFDPLEQVMGSTAITGASDAILLLKRGRNENSGVLTITGRDVEEQELAVEFDKATCQWRVLGDAAKYQVDAKRREILEYLEQAGELAGPKEIAKALGRKEENIKSLLYKMHKSGQVAKTDRGRYAIPKAADYDGNLEA